MDRLTLPDITPSSSRIAIYQAILNKLYEEAPRGYLDIRLFLNDWTTCTDRTAKFRIKRIEQYWSEMKNGILIVDWKSKDCRATLEALIRKLSPYLTLVPFDPMAFSQAYIGFEVEAPLSPP